MNRWGLSLVIGLAGCTPKGVDGWFVVLHGDVVDEDGAPVAGAELTFRTTDGLAVGSSTTDEAGEWRLPVYGTELTGNALTAACEAEGLADAWATWDIDLRAPVTATLEAGPWETWQATDRRLATFRVAHEAAAGTVEGRLVDASTGAPLAGVPLVLQQGWNAPIGTAASDTGTTGDDGSFTFSVYPAGPYTVLATPGGSYAQSRFPVFLGVTPTRATGTASPALEPGQLRASIVWADSPADLDLHLSAPRADGTAGSDGNGNYHVWAGRPAHPETDPEGVGPEASVELLDNDGTGPETVAIHRPPGDGSIYLSVFDNDHADGSSPTAMADADVVMQVWFGEDIPRFYEIDPGEIATLWNPVEIDTVAYTQYAVQTYTTGASPEDGDAFKAP